MNIILASCEIQIIITSIIAIVSIVAIITVVPIIITLSSVARSITFVKIVLIIILKHRVINSFVLFHRDCLCPEV